MRRRLAQLFPIVVNIPRALGGSSESSCLEYVVRNGENASQIVFENTPSRIYGRGKALENFAKLNRKSVRDLARIYPGEVLKINVEGLDHCSRSEEDRAPASRMENSPRIETIVQTTSPSSLIQPPILDHSKPPAPAPAPDLTSIATEEKLSSLEHKIELLSNQIALLTKQAESPVTESLEKTPAPKLDSPKSDTPEFEIAPRYGFLILTSQDNASLASASLSSQYFWGVDFKYLQTLSSSLKTFFNLGLQSVKFEPPTSVNKSIVNSKKFMSSLGAGVKISLTSDLEFMLSGNFEKQLFVRAVNTNSATIDAVGTPSLKSTLSWDAYSANSFILGLSGSAASHFPTPTDSYKVYRGESFDATLYLRQKHIGSGDRNLETGICYSVREQNTSLTKQKERNLSIGLKLF